MMRPARRVRRALVEGAQMIRCSLLALSLALTPMAGIAMPPEANAVSGVAGSDAAAWRMQASDVAPTARHENAFVALDGKLYLLGGRGERPLEIFDPSTGQWTQGAAPPLELHHVQAVAHDGRLWLLGALTGGFPAEPAVPAVWTYDPAADTWQEGAAVPKHRRRGASGVAVHEDLFYLVGGVTRGHTGGYVPWLDVFDPATGAWRELPDAPHARDHFHAAVLDGKLYAAGGRTSTEEGGFPMHSVEAVDVYDIATNRWSTLAAPIPTPRSGSTSIAHDGRLLVIGGEGDLQREAHAEVEAFDPGTGEWTSLPPLPTGRHGTQVTTLDGALHIVAGSGNRGGGPELTDHLVLDAPAPDAR